MNLAKQAIKRALNVVGLELTRAGDRPFVDYGSYIPFEATRKAARAAGMDIGAWIDKYYSHAGATQEAIAHMKAAGALAHVKSVCEIGAGSGRYLMQVLRICKPDLCHVYETAENWRNHLARTFPSVVAHVPDGRTLSQTADGSMDLVHAHKVFPGLLPLVAISYLREMARVVAPGGFIAFDALTERTFENGGFETWRDSGAAYGTYPSMIPREFVIKTMTERGCKLVSTYDVDIRPGVGQGFVFSRESDRGVHQNA